MSILVAELATASLHMQLVIIVDLQFINYKDHVGVQTRSPEPLYNRLLEDSL